MNSIHRIDTTQRLSVSYIDKSRNYYRALGYPRPYRWAHSDDVPFATLRRPLSEAAVTLVTTAMPPRDENEGEAAPAAVCSVPADDPPARLSTHGLFWDRQATHTEDLESYFPVHRLKEFAGENRIGRLAARLHCVPTEYSQRRTTDRDAPEVLRRCVEDGADAALLVPL